MTANGGDLDIGALNLTSIDETNITVSAAFGDIAYIGDLHGSSTLSSVVVTGEGTVSLFTGLQLGPWFGNTVVDAAGFTGSLDFYLGSADSSNNMDVTLGNAATGLTNTVTTGAGADVIIGGAGNDYINADVGNDYISAGNGTNTVIGGAGADVMTLGTGVDTLIYFSTGATLSGQFGDTYNLFGATDIFQFASGALVTAGGTVAVTTANLNLQSITGTTAVVNNTAEIIKYTGGLLSADTTAAAATALAGVTFSGVSAGDTAKIIFELSDGTNTLLFYFDGSMSDAHIDAAELTIIGTVDAYTAAIGITQFTIG